MEFNQMSLSKQINTLYSEGSFVMSIRYYHYKVNLYQLGHELFEVFIIHKHTIVEKIQPLDWSHSRFRFYTDQIILPNI